MAAATEPLLAPRWGRAGSGAELRAPGRESSFYPAVGPRACPGRSAAGVGARAPGERVRGTRRASLPEAHLPDGEDAKPASRSLTRSDAGRGSRPHCAGQRRRRPTSPGAADTACARPCLSTGRAVPAVASCSKTQPQQDVPLKLHKEPRSL